MHVNYKSIYTRIDITYYMSRTTIKVARHPRQQRQKKNKEAALVMQRNYLKLILSYTIISSQSLYIKY